MKKKFPVMPIILGTFIVVAASIVATFGLAFLSKWILGAVIKDTVAAISMRIPTVTVFFLYFILFEGIFIATQAHSIKNAITDGKPTTQENKAEDRKLTTIIRSALAIIIAVALLFPVIYLNCYSKIEETKITDKTLFAKEEFTLDDITSYRLGMNDTGLTFYINMYSGESFELLQSDCIYSAKFNETFHNKYEFAAHLSKIFDANEKIISFSVTNQEGIIENYRDVPEVWDHIKIFFE